jgi:hypothetical protein
MCLPAVALPCQSSSRIGAIHTHWTAQASEDYLVNRKRWLTSAENEKRIAGVEGQLEADQKIAVNSPMPTPESAAGGVYCEAGCHEIQPKYAVPKSVKTATAAASQATESGRRRQCI